MVFYRKYRPQTLSEILGQGHVEQAILGAFNSGNIAHAYLFCGPRGTGKTSTARILAKIVNCTGILTAASDIPCNNCASCKAITDGSSLDLIEMDAASNRGIEDIRQIRDNIKLAPTCSKKKVYIIDEVHMLSTEAFNALLKTLEEPPDHVIFILATTEAHKIPQTILSRVQRFDFKEASDNDLEKDLRCIIENEKLDVEGDAVQNIIKKANGSFRDGEKILDQLASTGKKITVGLIETVLGSGRQEDIVCFIESIVEQNSAFGLQVISKQVEDGVNIREFIYAVLDSLRKILLSKQAGKIDEVFIQKTAPKISLGRLIYVIGLFQEAYEKTRYTAIPSFPLEIALVSSCMEKEPMEAVEKAQVSLKDDVGTPDLVVLKDRWNYVLETVRPDNYSLEALLKQVKIVSCADGQIVLEVPYSFHQRILEAPKNRSLLESVLAEVLGKPVKVNCILGERPMHIDDVANVEVAADDDVIKIAAEIFNSE